MDDLPVLDDDTIARLHDLKTRVAREGEDVLGDLLRLFIKDTAARTQALRQAVAGQKNEDRRQAAHAIKGAALSMGALRVAAIAASLERSEEVLLLDALEAETVVALSALRIRL